MQNKLTTVLVLVALVLITSYNSFYIVTEGRRAIITQFGKPIGKPVTKAGMQFKIPFLHKVRFVDKRILNWDGYPNQIPTKDKKYIRVDTTARWQIVDTLKFIQTVQNERGAKARLDTILDGYTRDVISSHNLVEAVRNSNSILDNIKVQKAEIVKKKAAGEIVLEEDIGSDLEIIKVGREQLSQLIVERATQELKNLGIELIDVQLRRISYEESVQKKVYERMISERQRVAQKIRSIGKGEKAEIEGRLTKDLQKIESEAYKEAQAIRGHSEAKATTIYASSLSKDPAFYEFVRTMEAYKKSLKADSKFILSSDSEFLKYFK